MKKAKLNDYLLWDGKLSQIVAVSDEPTVIIKILEIPCCKNCGCELEQTQFSVITRSPLFQEKAEPIQTLQ